MITSTSNQQMKNLVQLNKKAKARREGGAFVAEGRKMFLEAPKDRILHIYVAESFLAQEENQKILEGYDYEVVEDKVFASVSDTQTPQGIITVVKQKTYTLEEILEEKKDGMFLVLESIQDPGNLGTMVRTGEGAGIGGIIMNKTTVDLYNPKTIRSTMGSVYRVPTVVTEDLSGAIAALKEQGITTCAAHLKGTCDYDEADYTGGTAFLIGNEGNGLTDETTALADVYVKIPMEGNVESLNAAIAATLFMYEGKRQRKRKKR